MDRTPGQASPQGTPRQASPQGTPRQASPQGTPTHYGLGEGPSPYRYSTPQGNVQRQTLRQLLNSSSVGPKSPVISDVNPDSIDEILIELVEGKRVEQIEHIPSEYFEEGIEDEEDDDSDLFIDIFLDKTAKTELIQTKDTILTQEEREEASSEFTDIDPDKYESIVINTDGDAGEIIKVDDEDRPVRTRDKRMSTPSGKIREIQKTIEEERQIKEILTERKRLFSELKKESAEARARRKEMKEHELSVKYDQLPPHETVHLNQPSNANNNSSSTGTVQGLTREECVEAGLVLTRGQRTEGGSDFSMMHYLHCPSTRPTPEDIGELPECVCWLCGFPMLTRSDIVRETIMMKRNLGQVSPEHTLPMTAGNALIGLPTKRVKDLIKKDPEYGREATAFLRKGLTYSHFWCNEVKNALRLVTWPHGELPKPNNKNINWLLNYMWHGIKRDAGQNRWFDEKACFVLYTSGHTNYKFSNLVHYFVLKPHISNITKDIINREREIWLDTRRRALNVFLTGVCEDIKRYTTMYHNIQNFKPIDFIPELRELSDTLKIVYKDRVIKGPASSIIWPPRIVRGKLLVNERGKGLKNRATSKINLRKVQKNIAQKRRTNRANSTIRVIRRGGTAGSSTTKRRR